MFFSSFIDLYGNDGELNTCFIFYNKGKKKEYYITSRDGTHQQAGYERSD